MMGSERESRAKTPHDVTSTVANMPANNGARNLKPHAQSKAKQSHRRRSAPHHATVLLLLQCCCYSSTAWPTDSRLARVRPPCPSPWLRGRRAIPIGKQSAEVLAGWLSRRSRGIARISKDTTATNKSTHHHHHNEGPIDSAPAHFLASMALRGSPCHRPRLSGPAATAARRLLFHTRQPGPRQEE